MKKIVLLAVMALVGACSLFAQTFQHDFQKILGLPYNGLQNYTLAKTSGNGFVIAGIMQDLSAPESQNTLVVYKMDAGFNTTWELSCTVQLDDWGGAFEPLDIIETRAGGYMIAGKVIVEGLADNGGFLMHLRNQGKGGGIVYDWTQIYPNSAAGGQTPILFLHEVVETATGYMAIGRSPVASETNGVVVGTDFGGNVMWSRHLFDNQYPGNIQSVLNDMVAINGHEVAIVGTVNSFTIDDADIIVTKIKSDGTIIQQQVFERLGKRYGDGQPAFLERGEAITYNTQNNTLVIAGTTTMKPEGHCEVAEFRRILTFELDYNTLALNWRTMHEVGADVTFASEGLVCNDIAYNEDFDNYAITGTVLNAVFDLTKNKNGFVLRMDNRGISSNLRYYGTGDADYMEAIESGINNSFVIGGTTEVSGKNYAWIVESYENIDNLCNQVLAGVRTDPYFLQDRDPVRLNVNVQNTPTTCLPWSPLIEDDVICDKEQLGLIQEDVYNESESVVIKTDFTRIYPTVITAGELNIENLDDYTSYKIISISGANIQISGQLNSGLNRIGLNELAAGIYTVVLQSTDKSQAFKFIIE